MSWCLRWNRELNIKVPPQSISPGAKRTAAAAAATMAIEAAEATEELEPEFKHKWQADIAAAVGVDVVKNPKQKYIYTTKFHTQTSCSNVTCASGESSFDWLSVGLLSPIGLAVSLVVMIGVREFLLSLCWAQFVIK